MAGGRGGFLASGFGAWFGFEFWGDVRTGLWLGLRILVRSGVRQGLDQRSQFRPRLSLRFRFLMGGLDP